MTVADLDLTPELRRWLLTLARESVRRGLGTGRPHFPEPADVPLGATAPGAAFVTLRRDGDLLGCIGSMRPVRSLAEDVAAHAFDAAFRDPRLPAVTHDDLHHMVVEISVLGPLVEVEVVDRSELLALLRPGLDGLLVASGRRQGTFLPSVWHQVSGAEEFVDLLWRKAGLRPGSWPGDLVVHRYEVLEFGEHADPARSSRAG